MSVSGAGVWHCLCCIVWQGRDTAGWGVQGTQASGHPSSCSVNTKIRLQTPDCSVYILCLCGLLLTCIMYLVQLHTGHRHSHLIHGGSERARSPVMWLIWLITQCCRGSSLLLTLHTSNTSTGSGKENLGKKLWDISNRLVEFQLFPASPSVYRVVDIDAEAASAGSQRWRSIKWPLCRTWLGISPVNTLLCQHMHVATQTRGTVNSWLGRKIWRVGSILQLLVATRQSAAGSPLLTAAPTQLLQLCMLTLHCSTCSTAALQQCAAVTTLPPRPSDRRKSYLDDGGILNLCISK